MTAEHARAAEIRKVRRLLAERGRGEPLEAIVSDEVIGSALDVAADRIRLSGRTDVDRGAVAAEMVVRAAYPEEHQQQAREW